MKILVGNNRLKNPGGSETYAYAMVTSLLRKGHEVVCVSSDHPGIVAEEIKKLGVKIYFDNMPASDFDVALLSHCTSIANTTKVKAFKIQTCHGIFHNLERPVRGMDAYVAISDEVHSFLKKSGFDSTIIYNGIDCDRFYPRSNSTHEELWTVLSLVHSDKANTILRDACKKIGCEVIVQNKYKGPVWDVENLINRADLVVGLGRSAYEAAACGRNVIIFDYRSYMGLYPIGDGFLTTKEFPLFLKHNCSGRYHKRILDTENLHEELLRYDPYEGELLQDFVKDNLNIDKQVDKYLDLVR